MTLPVFARALFFRHSLPKLLLLIGLAASCGALGSGCGSAAMPKETASPKPCRILSHTLATDEMLLDLVPVESIVGVTNLVDDPEISSVPGRYPAQIPRLREADAEQMIGLTPDLVCVASYNSIDFIHLLENSGLSIYRNEAVNSIDEVEAGILILGERVGEPERARELAAKMQQRRRRIAERLKGVTERPRVLFWSAGYTAGPRSTIDDLIHEAGATNVAAELGLGASAEISPERMVAADPDYVLLCRWAGDDRPNQVENHPILRRLRAVQTKRVLSIEGRYLTSVSQYVVEGVERLARLLHPERFATEAAP
jgi:iron complex transport system substrate-binding protein